jgi:hypothetical protein
MLAAVLSSPVRAPQLVKRKTMTIHGSGRITAGAKSASTRSTNSKPSRSNRSVAARFH